MDIDGRILCSACLSEIGREEVCPYCGHVRRGEENEAPALGMGVLLEGRYQLGKMIGRGGFGMTYAAWDELLQTPVAVKEYFPQAYAVRDQAYCDVVSVPEERRREYLVGMDQFLREARVLAMLKNMPGAVGVQDFFEENGTAYIVMDFLRGRTLGAYAMEHPVTGKQLFAMLRPAIDALVMLHSRGIMHRDITPNNLMVLEDGSVKLIDLGSAGMMDRTQAVTFATECYAPIEQYEPGGDGQGAWTDVYGLCATMYSVLTGRVPPPAPEREQKDRLKPASSYGVRLRAEQARALAQGLSIRPEDRQQSMTELRAVLYGLATPEELRQRRRYKRRLSAVFTLILLLAAVAMVNFAVGLPLGGGLLYAVYPDGLHVVRAMDTQAVMALPESRLGLPVSAVGERAFMGDDVIREVEIPGSVRSVGHMAFAQCERLEQVRLDDGVEQVGEFAFASCPSLHTAVVPGSVTSLSAAAFDGASPRFMLWGGRGGHAHQTALLTGWAFADRAEYDVAPVDGGVMITACRSGDETLVLPSYIDGQPVLALQDEAQAHVDFAYSVETLVMPAHMQTVSLEYVGDMAGTYILGEDARVIGENAFRMADGRWSQGLVVTLPEGLEEIGEHAFFLADIETISFPSSIRRIGKQAFDCSALTSLTLPPVPIELGEEAFSFSDIVTAQVPGEVGVLPFGVFQYCSSLQSVSLGRGITAIGDHAFQKCEQLEALCVPEGVTSIGAGAFAYCVRLKYVDIPASVTAIGEGVFDGCGSALVIGGYPGSAAQSYAAEHGIRFEDKTRYTARDPMDEFISTIHYDEDLTEVICPSFSVRGNTLVTDFHGEEGLVCRRVELPKFAQKIGVNAFENNVYLEEIDLPASLRLISFSAFEGCTALEELAFPMGLEQIETNAFTGCTSLRAAHLPPTLTYLGTEAFLGCTAMEEITLSDGLTKLDDLTFAFTGVRSVRVPGNIRSCTLSFYGCRQLEEIVFEEGAAQLYAALQHCTALRSVTLPASMKAVSRGSFRGCTALSDVYVHGMDTDLDALFGWSVPAESIGLEGKDFIPVEQGEEEPPLFADCPGVTIHAHEGSAAQAYAIKHGIAFELLEEKAL